jgi:hypothetical protein
MVWTALNPSLVGKGWRPYVNMVTKLRVPHESGGGRFPVTALNIFALF